MILLTGGAGFIGSCLQAALQATSRETVVLDRLGSAASRSSTCRARRAGSASPHTCADMNRLRAAGYSGRFTALEEGVRRHVARPGSGILFL